MCNRTRDNMRETAGHAVDICITPTACLILQHAQAFGHTSEMQSAQYAVMQLLPNCSPICSKYGEVYGQ